MEASFRQMNVDPKEGQLCLVQCPEWCAERFAVCRFEEGSFRVDFDDDIHEFVEGWMPLTEEGLPESGFKCDGCGHTVEDPNRCIYCIRHAQRQ